MTMQAARFRREISDDPFAQRSIPLDPDAVSTERFTRDPPDTYG